MMIAVFDEGLQRLVTSLIPGWTEIRARKLGFQQRDEMSFVTDAIMLVGETSLLCCVDVKDLPNPRVEYYPIYLKLVDPHSYAPEEWITLARKGGQANFERQVQWLFDKPSLRLLEREEDIADSIEPDARKDVLRFFGGLELTDSFASKSVKIEADDLGDFIVHVKFAL